MFDPHWVFKNSHGGKVLACESTDLSRGLGPHSTVTVGRFHTSLCLSFPS